MTNSTVIQQLKQHQADVMSTISIVVSIPALLASLPVCWVLRRHWRAFVCHRCCYNPFLRKLIPPEPTESDIVLSLILLLQTSDLFFAIGFLLTPINDLAFICTLQGALLQLSGPCAMLFSMCLSIELFIVIKSMLKGKSPSSNGRIRLMNYCFVSVFCSSSFLIADAIFDGFGRKDATDAKDVAWCWVRIFKKCFFKNRFVIIVCHHF